MSSDGRLLAPGNEAKWLEINGAQDEQLRALARQATVAERIERGIALSRLAHDIRVGVRGSDDRRS
jgi:hypothetical protein